MIRYAGIAAQLDADQLMLEDLAATSSNQTYVPSKQPVVKHAGSTAARDIFPGQGGTLPHDNGTPHMLGYCCGD
jgi:hypothetical protein